MKNIYVLIDKVGVPSSFYWVFSDTGGQTTLPAKLTCKSYGFLYCIQRENTYGLYRRNVKAGIILIYSHLAYTCTVDPIAIFQIFKINIISVVIVTIYQCTLSREPDD